MHYYSVTLGVVAGISLGFGLLYLFIGLRRKGNKRLNLTFALFALSYAGAIVTAADIYGATSVADYVLAARRNGLFVVLAFTFLIWYVTFYTGVQPRPFLGLITAIFISLGVANTIRPALIHESIIGISSVTLPWGEQLAVAEVTDSLWSLIFILAQLATIFFVLAACLLQYRRGKRQAAIALAAGMLWFVATIIVDITVEAGLIDFIILSDFGFVGLAVVISLQMANSVIKTEEELARHRKNLETLVEARTGELETANEQLAQEIVERKRTADSLRRRADELSVLNRISHTLTTSADLRTALAQVSETVTHLFDARYTHIVLPSDQGAELMVLVGYEREVGTIGRAPVEIPPAELLRVFQVLDDGQSLALSDLQSQPLASQVREIVAARNLQSVLLVPLLARGGTVGLMSVASDHPTREFSGDEASLAETIAGDVARAIENARLLEQAKASAAAGERNRIARELHDSVTQTLYSVSIVAEALPRLLERDLETARRNAAYLRQTTLGALAEMRALLFELRPATLEKASLDVLLQQLADVLTGRTRVPVDVTVEGQAKLPPDVKIVFYRIAQEAFNNITRHAKATQAWATLHREVNAAKLVIRDNGQGFDPQSIPEEHMGLRIMRERAEEMGAHLNVQSETGQGTEIWVTWTKDEGRKTKDEGQTLSPGHNAGDEMKDGDVG
jgi:signal transduction histidine kinase